VGRVGSRNADLVRALVPGPEVDIAALLRDDQLFQQLASAIEPMLDPELECAGVWQEGKTYRGLDGFRELWLDWLEPWATYHTTVEELIDLDDRVVAFGRDRATREDSERTFDLVSGSIWQFRDGRLVRAEFFRDRDEALRAAGVS
jgi:ketosteroid isomerase-like protein